MKINLTYLPLLSLVFIFCKLAGYIAWSWWLVLLPVYAPPAIILLIMALAIICGMRIKRR